MIQKPEEPGKRKALAFTLVVHACLVAALFLGVQWKRSQPEVVEVELWSSRPVAPSEAAPPPEPPPPEPKPEPKPLPPPEPKPAPKVEPVVKPDIALKDDKKKPEPKKPEPPKPEPKPEPKKPEPKPEPKKPEPPRTDPFKEMLEREERQRQASANQANQARLAAQADAEQRAAAGRRGLATWSDKVKQKIRGNIVPPPGLQGNPVALFTVTQLPTGEIIDVRLKRGSGSSAYDEAIERAIRKSSPLPRPDDPSLFQRELQLTFCPDEERGCR